MSGGEMVCHDKTSSFLVESELDTKFSISKRCVPLGKLCEHTYKNDIKDYVNSEKLLLDFLRHQLLDEDYLCPSCHETSEKHVWSFSCCEGTLSISVENLKNLDGNSHILRGHSCRLCTCDISKVEMLPLEASELKFGEFLQKSFSNVPPITAKCGHSLSPRDCLQYYRLGKMVACIQYVPMKLFSLCLPPSVMDFKYSKDENWIVNEVKQLKGIIYELFDNVQIKVKIWTDLLKKIHAEEQTQFLRFFKEIKQERFDIFHANMLRLQLLFEAYLWDERLKHIAGSDSILTSMPRYPSEPSASNQELHISFQQFWNYCAEKKIDFMDSVINDSSSLCESIYVSQGRARPLLLSGVVDTVITFHDNEVTNAIAYALVSYHDQMRTHETDARISFTVLEVAYTVISYCENHFYSFRKECCASENAFLQSLSRCKKWEAQGGKSKAFFQKSLDDRLIIKEVSDIELKSFRRFYLDYFEYLKQSISTGSNTCLAKIFGIFQVTKLVKGEKSTCMNVLVMENLLFGRRVKMSFDLKGSLRARYIKDSSASVLLDENLLKLLPTYPIFVGSSTKQVLERAIWNDSSFLAAMNVMDYSLIVGIDEDNQNLILGIIDYLREYTLDKRMETSLKRSGMMGGPKNVAPTVIEPNEYKMRFRKSMRSYFNWLPDHWLTTEISDQPSTSI